MNIKIMMQSIIATLVMFLIMAPSAMAHGGGLDSNGGHNCYVCVPQEYHYHRGGGGGGGTIDGPKQGSHATEVFLIRAMLKEPKYRVYRGSQAPKVAENARAQEVHNKIVESFLHRDEYREAHNERRRKEIAAAKRRSLSSSAQIVK